MLRLLLEKPFLPRFPLAEIIAAVIVFGVGYIVFAGLMLAIGLATYTATLVYVIRQGSKLARNSNEISELRNATARLSDQIEIHSCQLTTQTDQLKEHSGQLTTQTDQLKEHSGQLTTQTDQLKEHSGQLETHLPLANEISIQMARLERDLHIIQTGIRYGLRASLLQPNFLSNFCFDPEINILPTLSENTTSKRAIDVGANRGEFTAGLRCVGFSVDAFEPLPELVEKLETRFAGDKKVKIHPFACSDQNGMQEIYTAKSVEEGIDTTLLATLRSHPSYSGLEFDASLTVKVQTLDKALAKDKVMQVGLLKIDTEGHDLKVLAGAKNIKAENLLVEFWEKNFIFNSNEIENSIEDYLAAVDRDHFSNFIVMWRGSQRDEFGFGINSTDIYSNSWGNILFTSQTKAFEAIVALINRDFGQARISGE